MWIKFANLCRESDRMQLAEKTINSLMSPDRVGLQFLLPEPAQLTVLTGSTHTSIERRL